VATSHGISRFWLYKLLAPFREGEYEPGIQGLPERAARMVQEHRSEYTSGVAATQSIIDGFAG
jgi:hypothetical protein